MASQIYRDNEVKKLSDIFKNSTDRINIFGVSGAGGVGKTFLVDHVLESLDIENSGYLKLSADGLSSQLRGDFIGLIDQKLALRTLHRPAKPGKDYFSSIRNIADAHTALMSEVEAELSQSDGSETNKILISALIKGGQILNKFMPKSQGFLDFSAISVTTEDLDSSISTAIDGARKLRSLAIHEPTFLPRPVRNAVGMTLRNRIRRDLHGVTADYLYNDLSKFVGSRKARIFLGRSIRGHEFSKLLLVFDDFEVLGPLMSEFIFNNLIPRLENADFDTTVLLVGRDDFQASNPDWHYRFQRYFRGQIRLAPFSREQALQFLAAMNVEGDEAEQIYKYTEGFPFLLNLVRAERGLEGEDDAEYSEGAADIARQFFDRTTRWMSARQIEWFKVLVYLDRVNADTLGWFFPADEIQVIMTWFEREGSIRDPKANVFRVRGVIRGKAIQHLSTRHPTKHQDMIEKVKQRVLQQQQQEAAKQQSRGQ